MVPSDDTAAEAHQDWPRGVTVFMSALRHALKEQSEIFHPEPGVLPVRAVTQLSIRDRFYATYAEAEEDPARRQAKVQKAFVRALAMSQERGLIRTRLNPSGGPMVWLPEPGEPL
jgi:hypothetical protein